MEATMREIILQSWANSNMAGDAWRWEVYAVFNAGYWSVRGRQVDEITGKVYRVAGAYRLKSARGIKAGIERVFGNESIYFEDVEIDWDEILAAFANEGASIDPNMASQLKAALVRAEKREQALLNPKPTPESRHRDAIDQWIGRSSWPPSTAWGAGGMARGYDNSRRRRGIFQYVDTYFKTHGRFPVGDHHIDVILEDHAPLISNHDGSARAPQAPCRVNLPVSFPAEA
jgi:hypothetical protein